MRPVDFLLERINQALVALILLERRVDPYFRDGFDALFKARLERLAQTLIDRRRRDPPLGIAEERLLSDEAQYAAGIARYLAEHLKATYPSGTRAERAGNTKTYGVVRASFEIRPDLPEHLKQGLFAEPRSYPAWVRFAGPGPVAPPDIDDNGIFSLSIKAMGVPGEKLLEDERWTQDFTFISAPTFTTPNVVENVKLQRWLARGTPIFYFLNPFDSHLLDLLMQGLYSRTQANPLEADYWSCTSYLHGEGQAIHYAARPRGPRRSRVPRRPSANYLREAMVRTLSEREVVFDFMVQLQTDPRRMPIELDSVRWPEELSPFVPVATLRIPIQRFDSPRQLAFAGSLSFNPWHSLAAHRPLGNQNRARRSVYQALSKLRQELNREPHVEPTGDERFED